MAFFGRERKSEARRHRDDEHDDVDDDEVDDDDEDEDEEEDDEDDEEEDERPRRRSASARRPPRRRPEPPVFKPETPGGKKLAKAGFALRAELDVDGKAGKFFEVKAPRGGLGLAYRASPHLYIFFARNSDDYGAADSPEELARRPQPVGQVLDDKQLRGFMRVLLKLPRELVDKFEGLGLAHRDAFYAKQEMSGAARRRSSRSAPKRRKTKTKGRGTKRGSKRGGSKRRGAKRSSRR